MRLLPLVAVVLHRILYDVVAGDVGDGDGDGDGDDDDDDDDDDDVTTSYPCATTTLPPPQLQQRQIVRMRSRRRRRSILFRSLVLGILTTARSGRMIDSSGSGSICGSGSGSSSSRVQPVVVFTMIDALPLSQPHIAYRTDPYNHTNGFIIRSVNTNDVTLSNNNNNNNNSISRSNNWWQEQYDQEQQQLLQQKKPQHIAPNHSNSNNDQCPLQLTIGTSRRIHSSGTSNNQKVQQSPIILPIPSSSSLSSSSRGRQKQVVFTTNYEHLDLYYSTTSSTGSGSSPTMQHYYLQQDAQYPLLFESSSMVHLSPILHDVNADGILDVIVTDYDGSITVVGTSSRSSSENNHEKYHHQTQVPRLYIRREWMEHYTKQHHQPESSETNATSNDTISTGNNSTKNETEIQSKNKKSSNLPYDPFHSYFEYYYSSSNNQQKQQGELIRGHSVNVLHQERQTHETIQQHRQQQQQQRKEYRKLLQKQQQEEGTSTISFNGAIVSDASSSSLARTATSPVVHRRLQEVDNTIDGGSSSDTQQQDQQFSGGDTNRDDDEGIPELMDIILDIVDQERNDDQADDASILRDMDDQQHQYDRNPNSNTNNGEEAADPHDATDLHRQQEPPRNDDPVLAGIRSKQKELIDQEEQLLLENQDQQQQQNIEDVDQMPRGVGDDMSNDRYVDYENEHMMDDYAMYARYNNGDDMYGSGHRDREYNDYYDSKHYIRLPPHILTTPTLVEIPKLYSSDGYEKEDMLFVAVSYYFDEDEYDGSLSSYQRFHTTDIGDETEARRGSYVANAIMGYVIGSSSTDGSKGTSSQQQRWMGQTHLDLSSDYTAPENTTVVGAIPVHSEKTQMSALALSTPTVADLEGDGKPDVILGTNMGLIYVFDARQMLLQRDYWPIQLLHPIEHQILVEDVVGTTHLEMFVSDIGGTIACLTHRAEVLWQHNLVLFLSLDTELNIDPTATSPMTLGDIDGDGLVDIVQIIRTQERSFLFAVTASTGDMISHFPIELDGNLLLDDETDSVHYKLTQPLLVDLHVDQSFLTDYLHRKGGMKYTRPTKSSSATKNGMGGALPHGGVGSGLHIVIPHGENIFIVEGSTGCTQKVIIGNELSAMVQVDDVHGTDQLDLVIVTEDGNVMTLETIVPYNPLNTWTGGSLRNHRSTSHVHGYSASQGIFIHDITRQYTDIFGVYVPITFEIFDVRPNIHNEPDRRKYLVEIRDGPSWKRALWRNEYNTTGVHTERVYIRYGPGYYTLYVTMQTSHGIIYEDTFSIGYNIHFLDGLDVYLWLPLLIAAVLIFIFGASKQPNWNSIHDIDNYDDDSNNNISNSNTEYYDNGREGHSLGILGRAQLPS